MPTSNKQDKDIYPTLKDGRLEDRVIELLGIKFQWYKEKQYK